MINAHNTSPTAHQDIRDELATKQDKLTAGKNIEISDDNVISAVPAKYTAGENIEITDEDVINAKPHNISFDPHVILQQDLLTKVVAAPQDYVFTYNASLMNSIPRVYRYAYKSVPDDIVVYTNVTDKVYKLIITSKNNELVVKFETEPLGKTYTAGSNIDISDADVISAKNVVVVGGGNVAMDVSRVAIRHGANVNIVYRRSLEEMPARSNEIEDALNEAVEDMKGTRIEELDKRLSLLK